MWECRALRVTPSVCGDPGCAWRRWVCVAILGVRVMCGVCGGDKTGPTV